MNINNLLEGIIEVPKKFKNNPALKNISMIEGFTDWKDTKDRYMNYKAAKCYVYNLRKGGYDDWRFPTFEELKFIYEHWKEFSNESVYGLLPKSIALWTSEKYGDWIRCFCVTISAKCGIEIADYSYASDVLRDVLCVR